MKKGKNAFSFNFLLEAIGAAMFLGLCKLLGLDLSSRLGGFLGAKLGPKFKRDKTARQNLKRAMKEFSEEEIDKIIQTLWRNFGRTLAEYAHFNKFKKPRQRWRIETIVSPKFQQAMADHNGRGFFFSAHLTNWELMPLIAQAQNVVLAGIYQRIKNPYINDWMYNQRSKNICADQIEKMSAVRNIIYHIRANNSFGTLVDQKMLSGVWAWFFNQPAQTSEFPASMALKQNYALVPMQIERLEGSKVKFRVTIEDPLEVDYTNKTKANINYVSQQVNYCLEIMIRDQPQNWLWFHNRWPAPGPHKTQGRKFLQGLQ